MAGPRNTFHGQLLPKSYPEVLTPKHSLGWLSSPPARHGVFLSSFSLACSNVTFPNKLFSLSQASPVPPPTFPSNPILLEGSREGGECNSDAL